MVRGAEGKKVSSWERLLYRKPGLLPCPDWKILGAAYLIFKVEIIVMPVAQRYRV
jgi:hypothetical protein